MTADEVKQVRNELSDAWLQANPRHPETFDRLGKAINAAWHALNQAHAGMTK